MVRLEFELAYFETAVQHKVSPLLPLSYIYSFKAIFKTL